IREHLAAQDAGNAEWQRDLSVSHERIGDVRRAQGDVEGALAAYRASLAIAERLAAHDAGNAAWQRDLSISHNKIGDVRQAQGDLDGALAAYRASLAIGERLAAQDAGNAAWQRDTIVLLVKVSEVAPAEARACLTRALEIARGLAATGRLAPVDAWMPEDLQRRVAAIGGNEGRG
ncbi:MAG TPA: tetratricopeptide repeat protein, partial [Acetobacteraceae bacterium]|nr:tetratricopeptide repeat protein [Acetobacteraceae bacterium]